MRLLLLIVTAAVVSYRTQVLGCLPGYEKELRYLEHYLGIKPSDGTGQIPNEGVVFNRYIDSASRLNCNFHEPCYWKNALTDSLLDTSDFYSFTKVDDKTFPLQIQHGSPKPSQGSMFALAGNTTSAAQRAVLVSAPIACQRSEAELSFDYWLYNGAKVEVVLLRPNTKRRKLQILLRPLMDCHAFKPPNEKCTVILPAINEPFKIGIRALNLKDPSMGSFVMITNIVYRADICIESAKWSEFGGRPVPPPLKREPAQHASQYSCEDFDIMCRWSNSLSSPSEWRIGRNLVKWRDYFSLESAPINSFFYQFVDEMVEKPYSQLRSELIPCTSGVTSLSLKYWLQSGTQVQVCTETETSVVISCVYLSETDSPGPINIDVDAQSDEAFRFVIEMIQFDSALGGLVVIDDIRFEGLLCHETTVAPPTTLNVRDTAALFRLQRLTEKLPVDLETNAVTLDCDFENNYCPQWHADRKWGYGVTPKEGFDLPKFIRGNVAVAVLSGVNKARIQSLSFMCANGKISVEYFCSKNATLKICVLDDCIEGKKPFGVLSVELMSNRTLSVQIEASSKTSSIAIIRRIHTVGYFCPLLSALQLACQRLSCAFNGTLCNYKSLVTNNTSVTFGTISNHKGVRSMLDGNSNLAVLESPSFETDEGIELEIKARLTTFGSQLYICIDGYENLDSCTLLFGPKILTAKTETIRHRFEHDIHHFFLVAFHDKYAQFGPATIDILSITAYSEQDEQIC
uniref:MAM domain-containing protein n=1 Tax=Syphacia muris TaxID=451379 RepID=A0A0N5AIB5_9BILA